MRYFPDKEDNESEERLKELEERTKVLENENIELRGYLFSYESMPFYKKLNIKEKLFITGGALALSTLAFFGGRYSLSQPQQIETRQRGEIIQVIDKEIEFLPLGAIGGIYLNDGVEEWLLLKDYDWEYPTLSPDKNRVALIYGKSVSGPEQGIYVVNVDGSNLRQLTFEDKDRLYDTTPFWIDNDTIGFIRREPATYLGEERYAQYQIDIDENNIGYNLRLYEEGK